MSMMYCAVLSSADAQWLCCARAGVSGEVDKIAPRSTSACIFRMRESYNAKGRLHVLKPPFRTFGLGEGPKRYCPLDSRSRSIDLTLSRRGVTSERYCTD